MIQLSLIVPTRGRPDRLQRFLQSLRETARDLAALQIVCVVDSDDLSVRDIDSGGLPLESVVVPPGRSMGELHAAGYSVARGRHLMLLSDDLVMRTPAWDVLLREALAVYADGIVLAHLNDLLFRDTLCTFPVLSRTFCELAGGVCPPDYWRYCIDDHLHHVFDLIHLLGHTRRLYLPGVIMEHAHPAAHYAPDGDWHAADWRRFEALAGERRHLAVACVERIEGRSDPDIRESRLKMLERFPDAVAIRSRRHAHWWRPDQPVRVAVYPRPGLRFRAACFVSNKVGELAARWPIFGWLGGRIPPGLFDEQWYRAAYPDTAPERNALLEYLRKGGFEGRNPNPQFDSAWYLETNPDVAASGLNPLIHYVRFGRLEHRSPSLWFDSGNPQIKPAPRIEVHGLSPLSVVIPTRNRRATLARTLEACLRHCGPCEIEVVVIDDGSTDDTGQWLRDVASRDPRVRFLSVKPGGPGVARNFGAAMACHPVILFLGDDITPSNPDFFATHAAAHAARPEANFLALGEVDWPREPGFTVTFTMEHAQREGAQFAFSRLKPGALADWRYFYTANLSVKKSLIDDWVREGFDHGFTGAALEDIELGYRLWRSVRGIYLCYEPSSRGLHYHFYDLRSFLNRQRSVGKSLHRLLELHPELAEDFGLGRVRQALGETRADLAPGGPSEEHAPLAVAIDAAAESEAQGKLGSEHWHGPLLSALFEYGLQDGYVSASGGNRTAARAHILNRFLARTKAMPRAARQTVGGPGMPKE